MLIVKEPKHNPDGTISVKVTSTVTPSSLRTTANDTQREDARNEPDRAGIHR